MGNRGIIGFDHLVLRCADVETTLGWYTGALGLEPVRVDEWRAGEAPFPSVRVSAETIIDLIPATAAVTERNLDHICLVADRAMVDAIAGGEAGLRLVGEAGPRFGAQGEGWSVYVYDPDDNVVEVRTYDP